MKKNGPWTILKSELKYKNAWIEVTEDAVVRPDGTQGVYGVVRKGPGVTVLPMDEEGNVYLAEEFQYAIGRTTLLTIAGALDGDSSLEGAKRELKEELGIEAGEWIDLGTEDPFTSILDAPCHMYIARKLSFGEPSPEGTETILMKKMSLTEAVQQVMVGTVSHAQSALLILKAKIYLDQESD